MRTSLCSAYGCALAIAFGVLGCTNDDGLPHPGDAGGSGGAMNVTSAGGGGGSVGAGGAGSGGSQAGASSSDASAADSADEARNDGAAAGTSDGSLPKDAPSLDSTADRGDGNPGGDTIAGKPWIHLCPKSYTHEQCCSFLCSCLMTVCADSPLDKTGIDNCMTNCPKLTDMILRCRVYHCYESLNPSFPQDHVSHCGHASGRVAGGSCPTSVYQ